VNISVERQLSAPLEVNDEVLADIEYQITLGPSPDVLDNTSEIVVFHGYIMLFVIVFPIMPFLVTLNNYIELRVDFYNLLHAQRPVPISAAGLGVWKSVLATFNILAIFTNFGIVVFRTDLMSNLLSDVGAVPSDRNLWIVYFMFVLAMLFVIFVIRVAVDDQSASVKEAIARQEACDRHLLMAPQRAMARTTAKSMRKLKRVDEVEADDEEEDVNSNANDIVEEHEQ